jgi:Uma2 family endonuclease
VARQPSPPYVSYEDYVAAEVDSEEKHEWLDGIVYAMSRGTIEHGRLCASVIVALGSALKGKCTVYASETMLFVRETKLSTYADASVVCGELETHRVMKNGRSLGEALTNPKVLVEVLSDGTEAYDRGEKFGHYMRIPSLREYVLVSQKEPCIEVFRRTDRGGHWEHTIARAGETVTIYGKPIAVDDVYAR